MAHDRPKLELSGPQIIGGALAAASAAVASSWLGVAGTVLGAVIVSLVASVGSALYTHSLERSSRAIRETLPVVPLRPATAMSQAGTADSDRMATAVLPAVAPELETTDLGRPLPEPRRASGVQWRTVAVSALASLALAAAVLTGFESFVGKPASSLTGAGDGGGTTVSQLVGHDSSSTTQDDPSTVTEPDQDTSTTGETPITGSGPSGQTGNVDQGQPSQPAQPTPTGSTPTSGQPTGSTPTGTTNTQPTPTGSTPTAGN